MPGPPSTFDDPKKRGIVYEYVRETGVQSRGVKALGMTIGAWAAWKTKNKELVQKELAEAYADYQSDKPNHKRNRILETWNAEPETTESYIQYLVQIIEQQYILEKETQTVEIPVRDADGIIMKDEDGNVIWEVERRFVKEFHRGLPKYLHEYFQKLIGGMSEVPSENQVTVFTTNFLMFLQSHADLDDATYKEVVLGTQRFQENMKKKFLALKG